MCSGGRKIQAAQLVIWMPPEPTKAGPNRGFDCSRNSSKVVRWRAARQQRVPVCRIAYFSENYVAPRWRGGGEAEKGETNTPSPPSNTTD